jgi:hypothetical protein
LIGPCRLLYSIKKASLILSTVEPPEKIALVARSELRDYPCTANYYKEQGSAGLRQAGSEVWKNLDSSG